MDRSKIFISYSHKDRKVLDQFMRFVRPLERERLFDIWADTRLEGGEEWKVEIEEALNTAAAAVLFISQDFLDSDFIYQEELPLILTRADAGELIILPVYLSVSNVDELEFKYVDRQAHEHRCKLNRFQGIGTPEKPLESWGSRERAYKKLSQRIKELTVTTGAVKSSRSSSMRHAPTCRQGTMNSTSNQSQGYQLTIELERSGHTLDVRIHRPGTDALAFATRSWENTIKALEPIVSRLNSDDVSAVRELVERAPTEGGTALFDLLFGQETEWERVTRNLFNEDSPYTHSNPIRSPVRLRICTNEPLLLGLPWRLTAWRGYLLVDYQWEFTTSLVLNPTENITTTAPCNVLIAAPRTEVDGIAPDAKHPEAVQDVLKNVWPTGRDSSYVRVVHTRQELVNALQGMRPHLIYFYAFCTVEAGHLSLLLDGEHGAESISLGLLGHLFDELQPRPALVYLNVIGAREPVPSPLLSGIVPLVIWRRLPGDEENANSQAIAWLNRWLKHGEDPVKALHEIGKRNSTIEGATLVAHSSYKTWNTQTYPQVTLRDRLPYLALDRDHQKALVGKHLRELIRSDTRRVMALVPYAASGNLLSSLHEQLQYYLDLELADIAEINWWRLQFPVARGNLPRDLEFEMQLQLQADSNEPMQHLIRRCAPKTTGLGKRGILWLNWGIFGVGADHQETLTSGQLRDWLRFASECLGTYCPDDLRIVCYAAIELKDSAHPQLAQILQSHLRQVWCRNPSFRLSVLPPLGKVSEYDLFIFLEDAGNPKCPPAIHTEIAQRLIEKTGGKFESIAALVQEAEDGSWFDLLTRLEREQGIELPEDDERIE